MNQSVHRFIMQLGMIKTGGDVYWRKAITKPWFLPVPPPFFFFFFANCKEHLSLKHSLCSDAMPHNKHRNTEPSDKGLSPLRHEPNV